MRTTAFALLAAIAPLALLTAPSLAQHEGDLTVGRTGAGVLAVEFDFDEIQGVPESTFPGVTGWVGEEPGFTSLDMDEPLEDLFTLAPGADIRFELLAIDDGFLVRDDATFDVIPVGGQWTIGSPDFDIHPFWHAPAGDLGDTYELTFRLVDLGVSAYTPSPAFTMTFAAVPAPSAATFIALAGLAALRRRRI